MTDDGQTRADLLGRLFAFLQNPDHAVRFRKFFRRDNPDHGSRGRQLRRRLGADEQRGHRTRDD